MKRACAKILARSVREGLRAFGVMICSPSLTLRVGVGLAAVLAAVAPARSAEPPFASDLVPPVHILAGGKPLDVEREGHSAPFVGDFDGDGLPDLFVGQYDEGKLRIYRNVGTKADPRFDAHTWLVAGGQTGRVPEG
jgi:VCBS repeat protein